MSAETDANFGVETTEFSEICRVVCLYESTPDRDLLMQLSDTLLARMGEEMNFQFEWWGLKYLADKGIAHDAAESACEADLVFLATNSVRMPHHLQAWFDAWLPNRSRTSGALVLVQNESHRFAQTCLTEFHLSHLARQGQLDYLRIVPTHDDTAPLLSAQRWQEWGDDRPSHWGIND